MSAIQKFLLAVFPSKWAQSMEAESRAWIVKCPSCGHERSVWEMGGIRWKAAGTPKRYMSCPACQQAGWHEVKYRQGS
jgi:DNA-directed RNA polymerase subunit M/transcription elongation factor TFIIS